MENYISLQKSQLLDSLENQVRFSQLVAVLVGEKGIGKSYTLEQLQSRLNDEICVAHIDASLDIQEEQLQKVICLQLGLRSEELNSLEHIEKSIRTQLRKKALISIDNAHLLSNESLNSLLKLNQSQINHQESVLFLLLAGNESLPKNISFTNTFKNHQEMCVVFQLEAIEKSEVGPMVAAMSHLTNEEVEKTFGLKQLEYFWQLSKGIPAELEYQVSRWKAELPKEKMVIQEVVEEKTSYWKAAVYMILGITFVSILFYQDEINQIIMTENKTNGTEDLVKLKKPNNKRKTKTFINKGEISLNDEVQTNTGQGVEAVKLDQQHTISTNTIDKESENIVPPVVNIEKKEIEGKGKLKVEKAPKEINKASQKMNNTIKKPIKKIAILVKKEKDEETPIPINKLSLSKDEQFLLLQPSSSLALQWVGVSSLENAQAFRLNHPLKSTMYIYRRKQSNKGHLYLVISGLFSSRTDANTARERDKNLNYEGTPWVKPLLAIQDEINSLKDN